MFGQKLVRFGWRLSRCDWGSAQNRSTGGAVVIIHRVAVPTHSPPDDSVIVVIIETPGRYSEAARCSFSSSLLGSHLVSAWLLRCQMHCGSRDLSHSWSHARHWRSDGDVQRDWSDVPGSGRQSVDLWDSPNVDGVMSYEAPTLMKKF